MDTTTAAEPASESRFGRFDERLELVAVVLLGIAAMATSWAAFKAADYDGKVLENFTDSNLEISDANALYNAGDQIYASDQDIFIEYIGAVNNGDEEYALFIKDSLMRDELIAAVDWWEQPENIETHYSPFVDENPNYLITEYAEAEAMVEDTDESYEAGKQFAEKGDKFNLATVVLAASLFVLGIAGSFRSLPIRGVMLGVGAVILLSTSAWMLTI